MEIIVQHALVVSVIVLLYTAVLVGAMWLYYKQKVLPEVNRKEFVLKQVRHALSTRTIPEDLREYCAVILNDIEAASTMCDRFHNQYTYGNYQISALWYPSFGSFLLRLDDTHEKIVEVNFPT